MPTFRLRYPGSPKFFIQVVTTLEGGGHPEGIVVICRDVDRAFEHFTRHFKRVEAAGGVVFNQGRILCIHRRGYWDLPKGKIDKGETVEQAALREVMEETGIQKLKLGSVLPTTYHTYTTTMGKRILKPTYWFRMFSEQENLVPQTEEDIDRAAWFSASELDSIRPQMYPSLQVVLREALTAD